MKRLRVKFYILCLILLIANSVFAIPGDIVFVRTTDKPDVYVVCSENDPLYRKAQAKVAADQRILLAVYNYKRVQSEIGLNLFNKLKKQGLSKKELKILAKKFETKPIYFCVSPSTGGNSMMTGNFTVVSKDVSGKRRRVKVSNGSVITLAMNGDTMKGPQGDIVRSITHELGHAVMAVAYGGTRNFPKSRFLGKPHWHGKITDRGLAIIEGWAEFNGAYFCNEPWVTQPVDTGKFAAKAPHTLKTYNEMMNTEGVNASIFFDIGKGTSGIKKGYRKMVKVFEEYRPKSMDEFVIAFSKMYPQDAAGIYKIFFLNTFGACVDEREATRMYRKFSRGQISEAEYLVWLNKTMQKGWIKFRSRLGRSYKDVVAAKVETLSDVSNLRLSDSRVKPGRLSDINLLPDMPSEECGNVDWEFYREMLNRGEYKKAREYLESCYNPVADNRNGKNSEK